MSEQFALRISAGPDYQHLKVIGANDCKNPIFVNGPHFAGYISVKVRDFSGITPGLEARKLERDTKMGISKDEKPVIPTKPVAVEENDDSEGEFFDAEEGEEDLKSNASTKDLRDKLAAATMNMKDSTHLPIPKPSFPYFEGKNRRYSMMIQGRFKQQFTADEIVFGGDFDSPMIPPPGTGFLMKVTLIK